MSTRHTVVLPAFALALAILSTMGDARAVDYPTPANTITSEWDALVWGKGPLRGDERAAAAQKCIVQLVYNQFAPVPYVHAFKIRQYNGVIRTEGGDPSAMIENIRRMK